MKRITITGATSMIEIALINECTKNNIEVLAIIRRQFLHLCRLPEADLFEICECNLNESDTITYAKRLFDIFYQFAWNYTFKENRDNPILQKQNIKYRLDVIMLAKRLRCRKFIGAGLQAEYDKSDSVITPNTDVKQMISYGIAMYAVGKLSEKLCKWEETKGVSLNRYFLFAFMQPRINHMERRLAA